jgi:anti-sigma B factor antagonist
MNINAERVDNVTVMTLTGNLDATTADLVTETVTGELGEKHTNMVIDLSGVDFMSSSGLRSILAAAQEARNKGGDLRLAGANKHVKRVLDFSGFTKIMKYYDTAADAVADFPE